MHSAQTYEDEEDAGEPEAEVLSYDRFRNHLGLLDWRRRRAEYERRGDAAPGAQRRQGNAAGVTGPR